jgi:hypothetical protein
MTELRRLRLGTALELARSGGRFVDTTVPTIEDVVGKSVHWAGNAFGLRGVEIASLSPDQRHGLRRLNAQFRGMQSYLANVGARAMVLDGTLRPAGFLTAWPTKADADDLGVSHWMPDKGRFAGPTPGSQLGDRVGKTITHFVHEAVRGMPEGGVSRELLEAFCYANGVRDEYGYAVERTKRESIAAMSDEMLTKTALEGGAQHLGSGGAVFMGRFLEVVSAITGDIDIAEKQRVAARSQPTLRSLAELTGMQVKWLRSNMVNEVPVEPGDNFNPMFYPWDLDNFVYDAKNGIVKFSPEFEKEVLSREHKIRNDLLRRSEGSIEMVTDCVAMMILSGSGSTLAIPGLPAVSDFDLVWSHMIRTGAATSALDPTKPQPEQIWWGQSERLLLGTAALPELARIVELVPQLERPEGGLITPV